MSKICLFDVSETMLSMCHVIHMHLQEYKNAPKNLFVHK